jgi:hypothetical protein
VQTPRNEAFSAITASQQTDESARGGVSGLTLSWSKRPEPLGGKGRGEFTERMGRKAQVLQTPAVQNATLSSFEAKRVRR